MARFEVIFDRDAEADIESIRDYMAGARDLEFANGFADRLISYCESFADLPHRGTRRDEILPGLRTVGWRRTITVAFEVSDETKRVTILGVFYRGRDVLNLVRDRKR